MSTRVFICGFGTVGQGFAEVLHRRRAFLEERYGQPVVITGAMDSRTYVVDRDGLDPLDLVARKQRTGRVGEDEYTDSVAVLDSAAYDILVEVSPTDVKTGGAGLRNITHALEDGKDVITVNKGPLALKFHDLIALARRNRCKFRFEGSVGGAMPIINLCRENLRGENITSIRGIFNGTCNFILSKMDKGQPFEQVLKEAQQMGYAETDPTSRATTAPARSPSWPTPSSAGTSPSTTSRSPASRASPRRPSPWPPPATWSSGSSARCPTPSWRSPPG